jgi:hypothetical protein
MRVFETTFRSGKSEYVVEARLDDEPNGDSVALDFVGRVRTGDGPWQETRLRGTLDLERGTVAIDVLDHIVEFAAEEIIGGGVEATIELIQASIGMIPAIDPVLGCLLKSVASSVIIQAVRCWYEHRHVEQRLNQVRSIGDCLLAHGLHILKSFGFGFGRCVVFLGLGI